MLTYPDWVTALDRARLEQTMEAAEAPFVADGLVFQRRYASDVLAVLAVLAVLEVAARILHRHPDPQTAETWRDELIAWADRHRPSAPSLDAFAIAVNDALQACPWWAPVLTTPRSGEPVTRPVPDDRPHLTLDEAADKLRVSIPTLRRMAKRDEVTIVQIANLDFIPAAEVDRLRAKPKYEFPDR